MKVEIIKEGKAKCFLSKIEAEFYALNEDINTECEEHKLLLEEIAIETGWQEEMAEKTVFMNIEKSVFGSVKIDVELLTEEEYKERIKQLNELDIKYKETIKNIDEEDKYFDFEEEEEDEEDEQECNELETVDNLPQIVNNNKTKILNSNIKKQSTIYCFNNLDEVIKVAQILHNNFSGESSLYKNTEDNIFYLAVEQCDNIKFVDGIINEFCVKHIDNNKKHIEEHHKCMVAKDALEILSNF